jgi:predicted Zn-dependent peptidase
MSGGKSGVLLNGMMPMRFCKYLAGLLIVLCGAVAAWAQDVPEVVQFSLPNGLEVLLSPDAKVPKVGLALTYRVGGMNEPPGRSGFAHLFEHLMFSGTPAYPRFDDTYSALGLSNNAFTEDDGTTYVTGGLASALPVMLSVEADRMANLGGDVTQEEFDLQRNVVLNEMRQNVLDAPGQRGAVALRAALFPAPHPYAEATIGSMADLEAATLEDVRAFFARYYVPNNAVLAISGDFEVEALKAMIEETFGRVPRGDDVEVPVAGTPEPVRARIETTDRVVTAIVNLSLAGPAIGTPESSALGLAADLLGNPDYGLLREQLVNSGLATSASAYWDAKRLGGQFSVMATAADGVTAQVLEAALRQAVTLFAASELDGGDIERARSNVLLGRMVSVEALLPRAQALVERFALFGAESYGLADDPVLLAVTREDVQSTVRTLLKADDFSTLAISPGAPGVPPAVLVESTGVPEAIEVAERPAVMVPKLVAGRPEKGALPAREQGTFSNGIAHVHYSLPGSPMTYVVLTVNGGFGSDTPGKEGLIELTTAMLSNGAGDRDAESFSRASKDIGAVVTAASEIARSAVVLAVPQDRLSAGADLLADAVLRPRFDAEEWALLQARVVQSLGYRKMSGPAVGYYALQHIVFPSPPGRAALDPVPETVAALTLDDVRETYGRLFVPRATTIYTVGPGDIGSVAPNLERVFGGWQGDGEGVPMLRHPPAVVPEGLNVFIKPFEGEAQAVIYLVRPAPSFGEPGFLEATAVTTLLGGDFSSRLNSVMRETKGYSYGISAGIANDLPKGGGLMSVSAPVQSDRVGEALADIVAGFGSLQTVPVTAEELNRTVMSAATGNASVSETGGGLMGLVLGAAGMGMTPEQLQGLMEEVVALRLPDVQAEGRALSGLNNALVMIAGDPATLVPQLQAAGFAPQVLPAD